ncbi:efflux RND transporter periplasmic adaptor subunit [Polycladidibacter stylochi]|uniref:efflux RND transporter periplasmic adaptor subunit n=1 Tax=Polycladidibacter stylochi TaxID=1807766 RepID=UPI0009E72583|nr:efflux RND transporter periplasmic adaptor subunit [Pseudovibrio stylochi]
MTFFSHRISIELRRFSLPFAALATALLLSGCQESSDSAKAAPTVPPRPAKVEVVEKNAGLYTRRFTGRVEAVQTVNLAFRVPGQMNKFGVLESQRVKKGDLIASLDPSLYKTAVKQAEVQLNQAKLDFDRVKRLLNKDVASQGTYDKAETAMELAIVGLTKARLDLQYTELRAPYDAIITRRLVDNYTTVGAGTAVVRLQDVSEVQIDINVPETLFASAVNTDLQSLTAEFPANPGTVYPLTYREHSNEADLVTQTYRVTLAMPFPKDFSIFPGMTASVMVNAKSKNLPGANGLLIPSTSIGKDAQKNTFVWVVDSNNKLSKRPLVIDVVLGPYVGVKSGLKVGEKIVTAGVAHLEEGQTILPLAD